MGGWRKKGVLPKQVTTITQSRLGGPSSVLVVEDDAPTYAEIRTERDNLLKALQSAKERILELEQIAADNWQCVEDVALGLKMNCAICGKTKPCLCDDGTK